MKIDHPHPSCFDRLAIILLSVVGFVVVMVVLISANTERLEAQNLAKPTFAHRMCEQYLLEDADKVKWATVEVQSGNSIDPKEQLWVRCIAQRKSDYYGFDIRVDVLPAELRGYVWYPSKPVRPKA